MAPLSVVRHPDLLKFRKRAVLMATQRNLPVKCAGCFKRIRSRFLVKALDNVWHERCLKCDLCQEILYSFGDKKFYYKDEKKLCKLCYMRLFVPGGNCSKCHGHISSTENVLKFRDNTNYHLKCFSCIVCKYRFCVGDTVRIPKPNIILCTSHPIDNLKTLEDETQREVTSEIMKTHREHRSDCSLRLPSEIT